MSSLLATIAVVIAHTPIWVWGLYVLLLFLGYQRTRDSSVALVRVLILPGVVTLLAVSSVIGAGLGAVPLTLLGLVAGSAGGWLIERDGATRRLGDGRVWLRGDWWSFGQIVLVLIFRYAINVVHAMNPGLDADPTWHSSTLFISAVLTALFLGRTAARLRVYFSSPPAIAPQTPIP